MKKFLLAISSLVIALLVAEGFTRLVFRHKDFPAWQRATIRYQADSCFGWKIVPREYVQRRETFRINSLGLRGPELFRKKAPGEIRIFVLGGSSTFNNNSPDGNTWSRLLEKKLRREFGPAIRVVNGGTPGYTSYQSSLRLNCQFVQYAPDMVLVYHLWNDIKYFANSDIPALVQKLEAHGRFNERTTLNFFAGEIPVFDWLTGVSQIAARLRFALLKLVRHVNKVDDEGTTRKSLQETIQPAALDFYRGNLLSMRNLLAEKNIPFIIVKQGTLLGPSNTEREERKIGYHYTGFRRPILREAYRLGWKINDEICRLPGVECIPANESLTSNLEYYRDHVHLTDRGRERLVEVIFENIEGMKGIREVLVRAKVE